MIKSKYKIGQLVEVKTGDTTTSHQTITGILITAEGLSYQTKDCGFVRESSVVQAYKSLSKKSNRVMRTPRKARSVTADPTHPTAMSG